jgi:hypothetical protein
MRLTLRREHAARGTVTVAPLPDVSRQRQVTALAGPRKMLSKPPGLLPSAGEVRIDHRRAIARRALAALTPPPALPDRG